MFDFFNTFGVAFANFFKAQSLIKVLFYKLLLLSFAIIVMPNILVWSFIKIKQTMLPFVYDLVSPLISNILVNPISIQFTGLGGWLVDKMNLIGCITILLSAYITAFVYRIMFK